MAGNYYICDELYHHGIQGQRWGKRNGPPYPLDKSDYSSAEKKAAGISSNKRMSSIGSTISLNYHDHRRARNLFKDRKSDEKRLIKQDKIEKKELKLGDKGKLSDKQIEKFQKQIDKVYAVRAKEAAKYAARAREHQAIINETIDELGKRGYKVYATKTDRYVNYGRLIATRGLATAASIPIGILINPAIGSAAGMGITTYRYLTDSKLSGGIPATAYAVVRKRRRVV